MRVQFCGVRGSRPVPGPSTAEFGGNTSCVAIIVPGREDSPLILDGGTGIIGFGESHSIREADIFFSHLHYDHIQGLPFFTPFFDPEAFVRLYGESKCGRPFARLIRDQMRQPYYPIGMDSFTARIEFHSIAENEEIRLHSGLQVGTFRIVHPGGSLAYRIRRGDSCVVYCTDTSRLEDPIRSKFIEFARGADLLIFDAFFEESEYRGREDGVRKDSWGHSTWNEACRVATDAEVRSLALYHHRDTRSDEAVREIERKSRILFPDAFCAAEGMIIEIGR